MLDPRSPSVWLRCAAEPLAQAVIPNFDKGLMQLRAAIGTTLQPLPVVRTCTHVPQLAPLPEASSPRRVLLLSALLHTTVLAAIVNLPILFPTSAVTNADADAALRRDAVFQPLFLPILPQTSNVGPESKGKPSSVTSQPSLTLPVSVPLPSQQVKPDYAGAQLIISNPPHSPKGIQTIRRPDLLDPLKLAYPLPLPSLTMLPAPAIPAPAPMVPRPLEPARPVRPNTKKTPAIQASEPRLQVQDRTVDMPKLPMIAPQQPAPPPKVMPTAPSFAAEVRPELPAPKAVVVVNAVTIPPGPLPAVPEAELTSRFVIAPPTAPTATETASGAVSSGNSGGADNASAKQKLLRPSGAADVRAAVSSSGSLPKTATPSVPNDGAAARPGDTALPGLVISGGVRGRGGRTDNSAPIGRPSYGLTIISGGNSGGASRDAGVFSRNDTVYTVYIPMTDAGGGTPWPMEYALLGTAPANSGLLTPPVVLKKTPVTASVTDITASAGPVFLTGVIDQSGNLRDLRAIHASDPMAHSAMDALAQWEFQAAELDGKPVASKVLIGVRVSRLRESRKENQ